jgi:hypothetical protein
MKIMVSFELTEDYIVEADNEKEAIKKVQKIFDFKQSSQNDLLLQSKIDYHCDIHKKYIEIEGTNE